MGGCEELSSSPLVMLKPPLDSRVSFFPSNYYKPHSHGGCCPLLQSHRSWHLFLQQPHLHFTLVAAPIATTRPCHLLELLPFLKSWTLKFSFHNLWSFYQSPVFHALEICSLVSLGLLVFWPFLMLAVYHSLLTPFLFLPCLYNHFNYTLTIMFSHLIPLTSYFIYLSNLWVIISLSFSLSLFFPLPAPTSYLPLLISLSFSLFSFPLFLPCLFSPSQFLILLLFWAS